MPTETENFLDEEYLTDLEDGIEDAPSVESESQETFEYDQQEATEAAEIRATIESGQQAVLEQKGGEAEDWQLEYRGDSGYRFDGRDIRDPSGAVWNNADTSLHQEMLAQWREGGSGVFFLPDHREQTDDGEVLYVTQLILDQGGGVTYEIHKHEMTHGAEDSPNGAIEEYAETRPELHMGPTEETSSASETEHTHEDEHSVAEAQREEVGTAEKNTVETSATPDTWLADILDDGPLEIAQDTRTDFTAQSAPSAPPAQEYLRTGSDSTEAESLLAHAEDEWMTSPQSAEAILHAAGMPMLSPRIVRGPDLPTPGSISSTSQSSVIPQHENDNIRPRSHARSRVSKDGIILEMAA